MQKEIPKGKEVQSVRPIQGILSEDKDKKGLYFKGMILLKTSERLGDDDGISSSQVLNFEEKKYPENYEYVSKDPSTRWTQNPSQSET